MAKKLAITIAGAVSLGSYEAGVLWEILDAIRQHNTLNPVDRIVVDVITGASAGGMTAVILAQKLLYSANEFVGPYDNPLYNTWVKRISLAGLQNSKNDPALQSIFSSDLIEQISKEALLTRYADKMPPPAQHHVAAAENLRVGVALTNLNGVPYGYTVIPDGHFTYLNYSDQLTRHVVAAECDKADFWETLRRAAVASGAFPFAFRAQSIERSTATDPDDYGSNLEWDGKPKTFTYSDGGILQNQPLGMAKNLVDQIDCHISEERFYLFVSPHAKDPAAPDINPSNVTMADAFKRIVALVMGQSGFNDWITAHKVNQRVRLLDERATELAANLKKGTIDAASLTVTADSILRLFFPNGVHCPPGASKDETLSEARDRISKQYAVEMAFSGAPEAFRDSILAFESAAQLGARDVMTIYGITANNDELAGAQLQSFLGFFDQEYRDHDYDIGRTHAQQFLAEGALQGDPSIGPLRFTPSAIRPLDTSLDGLPLHQVPMGVVRPFRAGLEQRVKQMVHELHPAWPFAGAAAELVVDAVVRHLMPGAEPDESDPLRGIVS